METQYTPQHFLDISVARSLLLGTQAYLTTYVKSSINLTINIPQKTR